MADYENPTPASANELDLTIDASIETEATDAAPASSSSCSGGCDGQVSK